MDDPSNERQKALMKKRRKKVDMTVAKSEEMEQKCGDLSSDKVSNCEHFTDDQIDDMENDLLNFAKSLS